MDYCDAIACARRLGLVPPAAPPELHAPIRAMFHVEDDPAFDLESRNAVYLHDWRRRFARRGVDEIDRLALVSAGLATRQAWLTRWAGRLHWRAVGRALQAVVASCQAWLATRHLTTNVTPLRRMRRR